MLVAGKRYEWYAQKMLENGIKKNGLFTGKYDENNGNPIFIAKDGQEYNYIQEKDVWLKKE